MVAAHFLADQLEDGHHLTIFYKLTVNLLAQNSFGSVDTSVIVALIPPCCGGSPFLPDEDCNPLRCCDRSPVLGLADQLADAGQEAGYTGATNGYTGATNGSQRARGANWPQLDHWWSAQAISREPKSKHTLMVAHSSIIWTSCTYWWPVALFQKPVYTTCVTTQNEDGSKVNAILSSGASVKLSWEPTANAPFHWSFCPLHHLWHRHTGTLEV